MDNDDFDRLINERDPLKKIRSDSPQLTASWLKHGENQSTLQRIGHTAVSLAFMSAGLFIVSGAKDNFSDGNLMIGLMYCLAALFFLYLGAKGIRNAFRFRA